MSSNAPSPHPGPPGRGSNSQEKRAEELLERGLRTLESELNVISGRTERVDPACRLLRRVLAAPRRRHLAPPCVARLLPLVARRQGPPVRSLFGLLESLASAADAPDRIVAGLLDARDSELRRRAVSLAHRMAVAGRLAPAPDLVRRIARAVDDGDAFRGDPSAAAEIEDLIRRTAVADGSAAESRVDRLLVDGDRFVRRLAARLLDARSEALTPQRAAIVLGADAAPALATYLGYTRATHRDLVDLSPDPGQPPPILGSIAPAERLLGRRLLAAIIASVGWPRVVWGISVRRIVGVSIDGSLPFAVTAAEARLLQACGNARLEWERFLVVAHGGSADESSGFTEDEAAVRRFRGYNVAHAELLSDILDVTPLTAAKTRRVLERMERVARDFSALFGGPGDDARRVEETCVRLTRAVLEPLGDARGDEPASAEVCRLVQAFEDPKRLEDVRTVHGFKRYLHQEGLRRAFQRFRTARTANRTVDLVLASPTRILQVVQRIRYIDFEPDPGAAPGSLPYAVERLVDAFGRHVIHGRENLPHVEVVGYGNEVQLFVNFRNHPAFLRIDYSPPLQGGMIDLQYAAISAYDLDHHPDLEVPAIQRFLGRIGFNVEIDGVRVLARYDKERAFDLGDILRVSDALFRLLPYLMDIDWLIGGLAYPASARGLVADAWADFLTRWGVLPIERLVTADRRRVIGARGPGGGEGGTWSGNGEYRDRYSHSPGDGFAAQLREVLRERDLSDLVDAGAEIGGRMGQLVLEGAVLDSLRAALARGEIADTDGGLRRAPPETFRREHEGDRLARLLAGDGDALRRAADLATLLHPIERHLRFVTTGSVNGYPAQRAMLHVRGQPIGLFVLRDADGISRLALAVEGAVLWRARRRVTDAWTSASELDVPELLRRARRDNYLAPGSEAIVADAGGDLSCLRERFRVANPHAGPRPDPGDRIVAGLGASPGRAAGVARLGQGNRALDDFDGAVLVAPAIRPADAPLLRRVSGVISTGGGILSHAGLVAMELGKPSLIISGHWQHEPDGSVPLRVRRTEFREEEAVVGGLRVVRRRGMRESVDTLRDGDIVVVDADSGTVAILGQDRDVLALHQELRQLAGTGPRLMETRDRREILSVRGRILRAEHQLAKLVARMDRPVLARHAARELLLAGDYPSAPLHASRRRLLEALYANPMCGGPARETTLRVLEELRSRFESVATEARRAIGVAENPLEVVHLRLGAIHARRALENAAQLSAGGMPSSGTAETDIDDIARGRLRALRCGLETALVGGRATEPEPASLPQLLRSLDRIDRLLGPPPPERGRLDRVREESAGRARAASARLSGRITLGPDDGGLELAPLIGSKAANLGEIGGVLGRGIIPPWFAVTDHAFRRALAAPIARTPSDGGGYPPSAPTLDRAIEAVLRRSDLDTSRKALAIRRLWCAVHLPSAVADALAEAYRDLSAGGPGNAPAGGGPGDAFVAVRSSAAEEDAEESAWAGQFDTFLFVRGVESLLAHLKLAWAGLWSERAIEHRRLFAPPDARPSGGGVIVQRMVDSRVSGVVHTACAATGQVREMAVNVGFGLGEGIVSGTVEVDQIFVSKEGDLRSGPLRFRYRVGDKRERIVFDAATGEGTRRTETLYHQRLRPALSYAELRELVQAAARLEAAYAEPLDIEFAYEDLALRILQARPVPRFHAALRETVSRHPIEPARALPGRNPR